MKRLIIIGASGSIGVGVAPTLEKSYVIHRLSRQGTTPSIDFTKQNQDLTKLPEGSFDGVIFAQGINPQYSPFDTYGEHASNMWQVNIEGPTRFLASIKPRLNPGACIVFFSSVAKIKGSYDPHYAAVKSAIPGYLASMARHFPEARFNTISLGLVNGSRVQAGMTEDFLARHRDNMFGNRLISYGTIARAIRFLVDSPELHLSDLKVDGGVTGTF